MIGARVLLNCSGKIVDYDNTHVLLIPEFDKTRTMYINKENVNGSIKLDQTVRVVNLPGTIKVINNVNSLFTPDPIVKFEDNSDITVPFKHLAKDPLPPPFHASEANPRASVPSSQPPFHASEANPRASVPSSQPPFHASEANRRNVPMDIGNVDVVVDDSASVLDESRESIPESLDEIEHYFLWCSHGAKVGSDKTYIMECLPSIKKINYFVDSGQLLHPLSYDAEWRQNHSEIILDINRVMQKFRQPLIVNSRLINNNLNNVVSLPAMAFYGKQRVEHEYIATPMGLYYYSKQDGNFTRGKKIQELEVSGSTPIFYDGIFKYIKEFAKDNRLKGNIGVGFFCCREQHWKYNNSSIRSLSGEHQEPTHYTPLEESDSKYWFLMNLNNIRSEVRGIFESGNPGAWSALLGAMKKGCGINVLSVLGIIQQDQGREIVACLPATGTSMYKMCDYISQSFSSYKFGILRVSFDRENLQYLFSTLIDTTKISSIYYTIVKLYTKGLTPNGESNEFGHSVILVISPTGISFFDPQRSAVYNVEQLFSSKYILMDIILCNITEDSLVPKELKIGVGELRQRPAKMITGGNIIQEKNSTEKEKKEFKKLYDLLDKQNGGEKSKSKRSRKNKNKKTKKTKTTKKKSKNNRKKTIRRRRH